ncbi:hypothetical protein [Leptospira bouyouniensis]|uniref:hypothetical protein n=1 Tax=Leptospira bouyouniensis TaxID=2484911 RepID=UPI001090C1A6|nr:hypothetical protein [Leptospira bouyouniensis]TGM74585.1 hypothetical protein EHQ99_18150 [Leptospira bouyouniensis]
MSDEDFGSWVRKQAIRDLFWTDFIRELIQTDELKDSMKSYNDFHSFFREQEENKKQFESLKEAFAEFTKYKRKQKSISRSEFHEIYQTALNAQSIVSVLFSNINTSLTVKNSDDINIYESLDSISNELKSLMTLLGDVSFDHIENFAEIDLHEMQSMFKAKPRPRWNIEFELLEIARDEFRKEKYRNRKKLVPEGLAEN